jgi:hypothetical protein
MFNFAITQIRGNSFRRNLKLVQRSGAPVDLSGSTIEMAVRNTASQVPALLLTSPSDIAIDPATGTLTITIGVDALPVGSFRAVMTRITGALRETLGTGSITVKAP